MARRLPRPTSRHRLAAALLAGVALLPSCTGSTEPASGPPIAASPAADPLAGHRPQHYVALGDSFTAAPLVPVTDLAEGCLRSNGNYPALLAARLDLELTDVSCSGATTGDLVQRQRTVRESSVPPQLRALDEDTDLVTLGIGGNDLGLFGRLLRTCLTLRERDPGGAPCADSAVGRRLLAAMPRIGARVERALAAVQERAPLARLILVGYPRIAPAEGVCPRRLPLATEDVSFGDQVLRALDRAMRGAAERTGVDYLDLYTASAGHDVCGAEPWVNGPRSRTGVALAFHPLAAGAEATAGLLEELLSQG